MSVNVVTSYPKVLGGTPVFAGTRILVSVLFENLADGLALTRFLILIPRLPVKKHCCLATISGTSPS
ncbi:DUF433 domain-containing protein [Magnetovirga frankeli]|uniref:DUF433 domain-containing protein n=1 Tax=Magnetovirga frankeli TaxID=947516 RepID=UPI003D341EB3